jgi:hypothetical protein
MISAEKGYGCRRSARLAGGRTAARPLALPRGPDRRPADAHDRGRDHPRKADPAPARGTALSADGRDREMGRAPTAAARSTRSSMSLRDGHKGIVLGTRARRSRPSARPPAPSIGIPRPPVHLFLTVKVRENWLDEAERYSEMGLDFNDGDCLRRGSAGHVWVAAYLRRLRLADIPAYVTRHGDDHGAPSARWWPKATKPRNAPRWTAARQRLAAAAAQLLHRRRILGGLPGGRASGTLARWNGATKA